MKDINSRGFTLIELLGIIVVLVAIFLVSFPHLLGILKEDEKKLYNDMVDDLCLAGKSYIYSHMDLFPQLSTPNSIFEIKVSTLVEYGNVSKNKKNPKTNETIDYNSTISFKVLSDNSLDCEYNE